MNLIRKLSFIAAFSASMLSMQAVASNVAISPTSLRATDSTKAQTITLTNENKDKAAKYQVQIYAWTQVDGKDLLVPTRALMASPSVVEIAPGTKQVIRIVNMSPSLGNSTYYRVFARELPSSDKAIKNTVSMLINHNVPAAYEPSNAGAPVLSVTRRGKELAVTNTGATAARVSQVSAPDGSVFRKGALGWVLPGSMKILHVDAGSGSQLVLTVNGKPQTLSVN